MCKCVFCKKHTVKGLNRCEITGVAFKRECLGYTPSEVKHYGYENDCPNFTAKISDRIIGFINTH